MFSIGCQNSENIKFLNRKEEKCVFQMQREDMSDPGYRLSPVARVIEATGGAVRWTRDCENE